jgi:deoxyadenosine/deoxycytidine kinase
VAARRPPRIAVIGPCAAGKSTLAQALRERGLEAQAVAQEHTRVPDLYRHVAPDVLVYLDVSYAAASHRRSVYWGEERLEEQKAFMSAAREAADLVLDTDPLTAEEVLDAVLAYLSDHL